MSTATIEKPEAEYRSIDWSAEWKYCIWLGERGEEDDIPDSLNFVKTVRIGYAETKPEAIRSCTDIAEALESLPLCEFDAVYVTNPDDGIVGYVNIKVGGIKND